MASPVPNLATQVESIGNKSAGGDSGGGDSGGGFHPIETLKTIFHTVSPALVCAGAGAFIGFAIAGPPGILIGALIGAAFALLGMF